MARIAAQLAQRIARGIRMTRVVLSRGGRRIRSQIVRLVMSARARFHRRTLASRLLLMQSAWIVGIYLITMSGIWWSSSRVIEQNLQKQAMQWVADLDELGTPLYISRGRKNTLQLAERIKHFPEIAYVCFYSTNGKDALAHYERKKYRGRVPMALDDEILAGIAKGRNAGTPSWFDTKTLAGVMRVVAPVYVKSLRAEDLMNLDLGERGRERVRVIGYIDIGIDRSHYPDHLTRNMTIASIVLALLFLASYLIGHRLLRKALLPLSSLRAPLDSLARGEAGVQIERSGSVEIDAIHDVLSTTIDAVRRRDEALRRLADNDPLTGLVNRTYLIRELEQCVREIMETGSTAALLFVDLDQFKYINDIVGHGAGDRLLVQVAEALQGRVREHDVVARHGGDEFTVLVRGVDKEGALGIARSILKLMQGMQFSESGQTFNIYCSIGITLLDSDQYTTDELLSQADFACRIAKSKGRNRLEFYSLGTTDKDAARAESGWSQRIRRAIDEESFELAYQPIVPVQGSSEEFYEVLVRLPDKHGKYVLPSTFLPPAERFGMLAAVESQVLDKAFKALAGLRAAGRPARLSVNLSGQGFEDPELGFRIKNALDTYDLKGGSLVFEITEQTVVRYQQRVSALMEDLQAIGCRFALDDFGAGFSSYSYMKHVPIDYIKISGEFVDNVATDPVDCALVKSIVQIARALGKQTIAENVENESVYRTIVSLGVDYCQGFHLGAPFIHDGTFDQEFPRPGVIPPADGVH
jgi:diguanylate cyclase (GGDEF)-like protein